MFKLFPHDCSQGRACITRNRSFPGLQFATLCRCHLDLSYQDLPIKSLLRCFFRPDIQLIRERHGQVQVDHLAGHCRIINNSKGTPRWQQRCFHWRSWGVLVLGPGLLPVWSLPCSPIWYMVCHPLIYMHKGKPMIYTCIHTCRRIRIPDSVDRLRTPGSDSGISLALVRGRGRVACQDVVHQSSHGTRAALSTDTGKGAEIPSMTYTLYHALYTTLGSFWCSYGKPYVSGPVDAKKVLEW